MNAGGVLDTCKSGRAEVGDLEGAAGEKSSKVLEGEEASNRLVANG